MCKGLYIAKYFVTLKVRCVAREPDLKEIERKAYMSYHQDGLLDVFVGVYILGFGLGIWADRTLDLGFGSVMPAILGATVLPIWIQAKRKITMPRIGFVKFGPRGTQRLMGLFIGTAVVGLLFFMALALTTPGRPPLWLQTIFQYGMIAIGLVSLVVCSLFAYSMGLRRLYGYGLATLVLFVGGHVMAVFFGYILLILGTVVMVAGCAMLIGFVGKYPLQGGKPFVE